MTVKDTLISMLMKYPDLYENKWQCYHHLFSSYGNGYEWVNGELVSYIYAKRKLDDDGYPKKILPTLAKLGIKKKDIPQRIYKEIEDFTPIFHRYLPLRLRESRIEFAKFYYDTLGEKYIEKVLDGISREDYIEKMANATPIKHSILGEYSVSEYMKRMQCREYSYVYNYPNDIKDDWAKARQEWEDYLKSVDAFLSE